jgi:hypothetical protein
LVIIAVLGFIATGALALVLSHAWSNRHMASPDTIDALIAEATPIIQDIEAAKATTGQYPEQLEVGEWRYRMLRSGDDYELMRTHSHWVSSFNAILYSPDHDYRPVWYRLRFRKQKGWLYVVGAQDAYMEY